MKYVVQKRVEGRIHETNVVEYGLAMITRIRKILFVEAKRALKRFGRHLFHATSIKQKMDATAPQVQ